MKICNVTWIWLRTSGSCEHGYGSNESIKGDGFLSQLTFSYFWTGPPPSPLRAQNKKNTTTLSGLIINATQTPNTVTLNVLMCYITRWPWNWFQLLKTALFCVQNFTIKITLLMTSQDWQRMFILATEIHLPCLIKIVLLFLDQRPCLQSVNVFGCSKKSIFRNGFWTLLEWITLLRVSSKLSALE